MAEQMNDAPRDEVSPELDAMVCDLLDDFLNALADGEDLGVVLIAEDSNANRYQACFTEDGPEACLEGAQHFIEANAAGLADGEDLGVVLIAEDSNANRYQACFTEDGPEACLEGAQHFIEANAAGIQSDHVGPLDRYAIDSNANRYQACFTEDGPEACLEGAQHFIEANAAGIQSDHVGPLDRYAIAYAGGVELDCEFRDAIIVSFYQRGMFVGYSAYVLYSGAGTGEGFMWCDPEPAGEEPPLL